MSVLRPRPDRAAGIYLHLPFCGARCPYCTYPTASEEASDSNRYDDYARALIEEYEARRHEIASHDVRSIYMGGGTPSRWSSEALASVLDRLRRDLERRDLEVTIEANPDDLETTTLRSWRTLGINRVNVGVQSFHDELLQSLGRDHDGAEAHEALSKACQWEHLQVGCDLLFGLSPQTVEMWQRDLDRLETFETLSHVTTYECQLSSDEVRGRTTFTEAPARRRREMLRAAVETCRKLGFRRYEVGSFARHKRGMSSHNTLYWTGGTYLGLGMGAHSFRIEPERGALRRTNPRELEVYLEAPSKASTRDVIDPCDYWLERLVLASRTRRGLHPEHVKAQFEGAITDELLRAGLEGLERLADRGIMAREEGRYRPTDRGLELEEALTRWWARRLPTGS